MGATRPTAGLLPPILTFPQSAHKGGRIDRLRGFLSKLGYGVKTSLRDEAEPPGVGPPETT
jgi:hypothetical protein